jgi:actin-related protein
MFPGLASRMHKEITALAPYMKIKIIDSPECTNLVWKGGAKVALLPIFKEVSYLIG